ncbi:MAG TPA: hypothetical protein VFV02_10050 [Acidimicrobiales bacterium]|nr:hypothetical protein [Acidimicrobiales bacterium]
MAAALVLATVGAAPKALAADSYTLACSGGEVKAVKGSAGWGYIRITVRNGCSSSQRVKVIVSNNLDTACLTYSPGQTREFVYSWPSDLDRIAYC